MGLMEDMVEVDQVSPAMDPVEMEDHPQEASLAVDISHLEDPHSLGALWGA